MKKLDQQRRKTDLRTLDAATLAHVTGGDAGATAASGKPKGYRQHDDSSMLGEKGAF